ncbi:hypothetical protein LMG7974_00271 [Campylobacter majalis]|uniref:Periplasmic protein n=1 Tax=Campylobacter majalis TaxID=2790656 RepID=A0ABN7K4B8_9BACT|nr:hypothetical protein [Campylobacter majalis]CAD7287388.1 hypothetical protein LMG7974_00271 [Campylobacter majalis]
MRLILVLFCIFLFAFTKEQTLSPIKPATVYYMDLEPDLCNEICLSELLKKDMIVSFLARFNFSYIKNLNLIKEYKKYYHDKENFYANNAHAIAVIMPEKIIKSYTNIITNTLIAYLSQLNSNIKIIFIKSGDESEISINKALIKAREIGISSIIAVLTQDGTKVISTLINENEVVYIPTINAKLANTNKQNLIFGGVDYEAQIKALLSFSNDKISAFSDGSNVARWLNNHIKNEQNNTYEITISQKQTEINSYLSKANKLNNSSIFLNIPPIKASLVVTQFKMHEIQPYGLFSTQINFDTKILSLIKNSDRKNLYIANSINMQNQNLIAKNSILNININTNWLAYACSIGIDYLLEQSSQKTLNLNATTNENQIMHDVKIYKADNYAFKLVP